MFLAGAEGLSRDSYRAAPSGYAIDAARVQTRALTSDSNSSGATELTDEILTLNFLFLGGGAPRCFDAADTSASAALAIHDAGITFGFLLGRGAAPAPPSPSRTSSVGEDCASDPIETDLDRATIGAPCL